MTSRRRRKLELVRRHATPLRLAAALVCVGGALAFGVLVRKPSVRASFGAAYLAFCDPSLMAASPAAHETPPIDVMRLDGRGAELDAALAHEFDRARDQDLDDPDGATLATLSLPDLRISITKRTMRYVRFFARTEPGRRVFRERFRRGAAYREHIESALREAGLPEDLVWVVAIESGFDPRSLSSAGAAGLWQFMPETGALYGLEQSPWVDQRRSIARATTAAVAHLRDLYERLHRWDLALAAYNAGYDSIVRAMDKVRASGERASTFAELASARALPAETANYVPQIMAFAIVAQNRDRFDLEDLDVRSPIDFGEIAVPEGTRLRTIARAAGVPVSVVREYNPELLRDRTPPTGGDYLVLLPADRVQHALAAFPAYLDQELVRDDDDEETSPGVAAPPKPDVPGDDDDPLPKRPRPLGRNRLPSIAEGRESGVNVGALANLSVFDSKLPMVMVGQAAGWEHPSDPLGLFGAASANRAKASEAIEKQLGFLNEPVSVEATRGVTLPCGVVLRVHRDPAATLASITVRIATPDDGAMRRGAINGGVESVSTVTVAKADAEAGIELAAARIRTALGDAGDAGLADARRFAAEPRRRALAKVPYGAAWLALGDALFPPGSPFAGTVFGAREDGYSAPGTLLVDALASERARSKASITISGDVDEARARQLVEAFVGGRSKQRDERASWFSNAAEQRLEVEDDVADERILYGWVAPGEGEPGDAAMRLLFTILGDARIARLEHALGATGTVSASAAVLDVAPGASIAAIEIAPVRAREAEARERLDAELDTLASNGPTGAEVGAAKAYLRLAIEKDQKSAARTTLPAGTPHSTPLANLRHAADPARLERLLKAIDEVDATSLRAVAKRTFVRHHRVVVTTLPHASETRAASSSALDRGGLR